MHQLDGRLLGGLAGLVAKPSPLEAAEGFAGHVASELPAVLVPLGPVGGRDQLPRGHPAHRRHLHSLGWAIARATARTHTLEGGRATAAGNAGRARDSADRPRRRRTTRAVPPLCCAAEAVEHADAPFRVGKRLARPWILVMRLARVLLPIASAELGRVTRTSPASRGHRGIWW